MRCAAPSQTVTDLRLYSVLEAFVQRRGEEADVVYIAGLRKTLPIPFDVDVWEWQTVWPIEAWLTREGNDSELATESFAEVL